jgi:hypothetical protein
MVPLIYFVAAFDTGKPFIPCNSDRFAGTYFHTGQKGGAKKCLIQALTRLN